MIRADFILPLSLTFLYFLLCSITVAIAPILDNNVFYLGSVEFQAGWALRDLCWASGLFCALVGRVKDETLRKTLSDVLSGNGAFMMVMLIFFNSEYSSTTYYWNLAFTAAAAIYTFIKLNKNHTQ